MADEGLLIPIQFTLEEARAALSQLEAQARASGQRAGDGLTGGMTSGLAGLKGKLGPARESMMFFTSSLAEFGPAGRTAQTAVSGLGSALMAATPVLAGVAAGMALVRLAAGAISDSMEEADAKAKATTQALKALTDASRTAYMAEAARLAQARGQSSFETAQKLLAITREEEAAKRDLASATWTWQQTAAQGRIEEARASRTAFLLTEAETAALRRKVSAIEFGKQANADAWARQEAEAARLTAAEDKAKNEREAKRKADAQKAEAAARKADADVVARVKAELDAEVEAANERAATAAAEEGADARRAAAAIDRESRLMEFKEANHLAFMAWAEAEKQAIEGSLAMGALRNFAGQFTAAFGPALTTSAAYTRAMKAAGKETQAGADISAAAVAAWAQNTLAGLAAQAVGESLMCLARGLAFASTPGLQGFAAGQYAAAAKFAVVAGLSGGAAIAIGQTRGMTAAERSSVADAQASGAASSATSGGAREFTSGSTSGAGGAITVRETVYVVGDPFETPAETARRAARVMELAGRLDMVRRAG